MGVDPAAAAALTSRGSLTDLETHLGVADTQQSLQHIA